MQEQVYEIENLSVPHFLTITSNTALFHLPNENLYLVFWGITRPIKNGPNPLWLTPPFDDFKISPKLYVPPTLTNMRTMRRQYTKFSLLLVPQANLFTRLFTTPQLTVDPYQGVVLLTACWSLSLIHTQSQGHREPGNKFGVWIKILLILNVVL